MNETCYMSEGIRCLCAGEIGLSLSFFKLQSPITAKAVFSDLFLTKPPTCFFQSDKLPTELHFNWCCYQFAIRFGAELSFDPGLIILFQLKYLEYKDYTCIFNYIQLDSNRETLTPSLFSKLYVKNRELFLFIARKYREKIFFVDFRSLLCKINRLDLMSGLVLDEKHLFDSFIHFLPELNDKEHNIIVQSAIECKNEHINVYLQGFLCALKKKAKNNNSYIKLLHATIESKHHIDDLVFKPIISLIESDQFVSAYENSSHNPSFFVLSFFSCFPSLVRRISSIGQALEISRKVSISIPSFTDFLDCIQNDLFLLDKLYILLGQTFLYEELFYHSIPFHLKPLLNDVTIEPFLFLQNFESYSTSISNSTTDFVFIVSYVIFECILRNQSPSSILKFLIMIDDPIMLQWMLVDLFSMIFLSDKNGKLVLSLDTAVELLSIIQQFAQLPNLVQYVEFTFNKINCFPIGLVGLSDLFLSSQDLFYPLIFHRKFRIAGLLPNLKDSNLYLLQLYQFIDHYYEDQIVPKFNNERIRDLFFLEIGLSQHNLSFLGNVDNCGEVISRVLIQRKGVTNPLNLFSIEGSLNSCVQSIELTFSSTNRFLQRFSVYPNFPLFGFLVEIINTYISVGASTPQHFYSMKVHDTLDVLINTNRFALAMEFSSINRVDFFQYLFLKYKANESILKMVSSISPLASFSMAISSLSPTEQLSCRNIIIQPSFSDTLIKYFDRGFIKREDNGSSNVSIRSMIVENSPELDDIIYKYAPNQILEEIKRSITQIPISKTIAFLDFIQSFIELDPSTSSFLEKISFFATLPSFPDDYFISTQHNFDSEYLTKLISLNLYHEARKFSEYNNLISQYIQTMSDIILRNNSSGYYLLSHCLGYHSQIYLKLEQTDFHKRYSFFQYSQELQIDPLLSNDYDFLRQYFYIDQKHRKEHTTIMAITNDLFNNGFIDELELIYTKFPLIDIGNIVSKINEQLYQSVFAYGDSLSLPIITPVVSIVFQIIDKFNRIINTSGAFHKALVSILTHLSSFIIIDCEEHEMYLSRVLISIRRLISYAKRIIPKSSKVSLLDDRLEILRRIEKHSYFSRFGIVYGYEDLSIPDKVKQILDVAVLNNHQKLSVVLSSYVGKFYHCHSFHNLVHLIQIQQFDEARYCFSQITSLLTNLDFSEIKILFDSIIWHIKSPLCLDYDWIKEPVADWQPQSIYQSAKRYLVSKTHAFPPSSVSECSFYISSILEPSDVISFCIQHKMFFEAFKELENNSFDSQLFIHSIIVPSLSYDHVFDLFHSIDSYDPYLQKLEQCLFDAQSWAERFQLVNLEYIINITLKCYDKAIQNIEYLFTQYHDPDYRKKIIQNCLDQVPHTIKLLNRIKFQRDLFEYFSKKKISVSTDIHMFGDSIHRVMSLLFKQKEFPFAMKIATILDIDPKPSLLSIADSLTLSKARSFISSIQRNSNEVVYKSWLTVFLFCLHEDQKTHSFVPIIIDKEISSNNPKLKCHFYIQFGYIKEAKILANREKLYEFVDLLSSIQ